MKATKVQELLRASGKYDEKVFRIIEKVIEWERARMAQDQPWYKEDFTRIIEEEIKSVTVKKEIEKS